MFLLEKIEGEVLINNVVFNIYVFFYFFKSWEDVIILCLINE